MTEHPIDQYVRMSPFEFRNMSESDYELMHTRLNPREVVEVFRIQVNREAKFYGLDPVELWDEIRQEFRGVYAKYAR